MSKEQDEMSFGTADFAASARAPQAREQMDERLAALFPSETAEGFRTDWDAVQIGFVDDPRKAVRQADELVATVMKTLAESFASQRISIRDGRRTERAGFHRKPACGAAPVPVLLRALAIALKPGCPSRHRRACG